MNSNINYVLDALGAALEKKDIEISCNAFEIADLKKALEAAEAQAVDYMHKYEAAQAQLDGILRPIPIRPEVTE